MLQMLLKACLYGLIITGFATIPTVQISSISGKISPADAPESVWAIMGSDSARTIPAKDGSFELITRAGIWKLIVMAKQPYKSAAMERVEVTDGSNTDVGEIKLEKVEKH